MAAKKSSRVHPKYKTKYRVRNWAEYDTALRKRGDVTVWFDEDAVETWTPPKTRRRGGQRLYSNLAIVTALTLREVFRLPLRRTEGFLNSILRLMDLDLASPDHTTLSRRNKDVEVPRPSSVHEGPVHLIVDSTGLTDRIDFLDGACHPAAGPPRGHARSAMLPACLPSRARDSTRHRGDLHSINKADPACEEPRLTPRTASLHAGQTRTRTPVEARTTRI